MRALLVSSSNVHGYGYLDHAEQEVLGLLGEGRTVAFVPFALADHEAYTNKVRERFAALGREVIQVREAGDLDAADAVFVGGGNTFRLLLRLWQLGLVHAIREKVQAGMPYMGSSAGTNVATPSIMTTNDMPIVYPPTFEAIGLVPFQINPHYLDPDPSSTHKGETREQRILEFLEENATPVVGLREGSMLRVENDDVTLTGMHPARIFERGREPRELAVGSKIRF